MQEKSLYPVVARYFRRKGYVVFVDDYRFHYYFGMRPDILAVDLDNEEIVVVEVKARPRYSLYQLYRYTLISDYVYLALPMHVPLDDVALKAMLMGVGVMRIKNGDIYITYQAKKQRPYWITKEAVLRRVKMMLESTSENDMR